MGILRENRVPFASELRRIVSPMSVSTIIDTQERAAKPAITAGFKRRCPNCHEGSMFDGYLQAVHSCAVCGEELHHHRADDGPAYIVILLVAHIVGFVFHFAFNLLNRDPVLMISVLVPLSVGLCLVLLPRVKGGLIGLQWAKRMHGFSVDHSAN